MPEIFRREIKNGFVCIWNLCEPPSFFLNCIEVETLEELKNNFEQEKRLREKFAVHYILKNHNPLLKLKNIEPKPRVNNGFVSVSHCKNFMAVAYSSSTEIGIDIESYGDRILKIVHKFLGPAETIFCENNTIKCLVVWACKEAIFKKFGGDTVFFKENIIIDAFETKNNFEINANININKKMIHETLKCELFEEFIMVHTN